MAVHTLQAPMPEIELAGGMKVKLEAINPTTGAAVTGVTATAWAIYGNDLSAGTGALLSDEVPRWLPEEAGEFV